MGKTKLWLAIAVTSVAAFEGLRLNAYPDIGNVPTICYGETKDVSFGDKKTKAECDEMLSSRLMEFNAGVNGCIRGDLSDTRRAAYVSLSYNIGTAAFCKSTVVKRHNSGDLSGACNAMMMWNKVQGVEWSGLTNRRKKERELCLRDT